MGVVELEKWAGLVVVVGGAKVGGSSSLCKTAPWVNSLEGRQVGLVGDSGQIMEWSGREGWKSKHYSRLEDVLI